MSDQFFSLPPGRRVAVLREIIARLSPFEAAVARKELLAAQDPLSFDVIACLPREVAHLIFELLDPRSLNMCAQVSRLWRSSATAGSVVGRVVGRAAYWCRPPAAAGGCHEQLRRLLEREWRWTHDRPAICRAIAMFSSIAALAVGGRWMAASCGRRLLAWRAVGGDAVLGFDVWTISAKSLALCPSGETMAYASYLRHAVVYSLATREELFAVQSEVEGYGQADVLHEHFALQKLGGAIEVYDWRQRRLLARIAAPGAALCGMRICSREWIVAASADWNTHVFRVADGALLFSVDSGATARDDGAAGETPRLKAVAHRPGLVRVALYSSRYWLTFDVHVRRQRAHRFVGRRADEHCTILDAHFSHMLTAHRAASAGGWQVSLVGADGRPSTLGIPAPGRLAGHRPHSMPGSVPRAAIDDDAVLASVQQGAIAAMRFSR